MSKKVLIFGAGGFVGRYLTEELLTHDYQVFGTDTHAPAGEKRKFPSLQRTFSRRRR